MGAGISGLTAAHELYKYADVTIYEKDYVAGGFAQSNDEGIPTEHSWRGYAPFYANLFSICRKIPFDGGSVFDNILTNRPISFVMPSDNTNDVKNIYRKNPSFLDKIKLGHYTLLGMLSDKRMEKISRINFKKLLAGKLSTYGNYEYIKMLGPGLGLDQNNSSLSDISKYAELKLDSYFAGNDKALGNWYVLNGPTNEQWIDPWKSYLEKKGVKIFLNSVVDKINYQSGKIKSIIVNGEEKYADIFISCMGPYEFSELIPKNTSCPELQKVIKLSAFAPQKQIAFAMLFNTKIKMPKKNIVFMFPDSEYNITVCPQDEFFAGLDKSLWSGTLCVTYTKGRLYGKPAIDLTKAQLKEEIKAQMFDSAELEILLGCGLRDKVEKIVIWKDWKRINGKLESHPKWVTTTETFGLRPKQRTDISNLYMAGSHTYTTTKIWSMEGAVESGKLASIALLDDCNIENNIEYYPHTTDNIPLVNKLKKIDNCLYNANLPNIIYFIYFIILIILLQIYSSSSSYSDKMTYSSYR